MNVALPPESAINIISLCTGGGGLDLGLELALPSARSVVMVEREAFAVAHLVSAIEQGLLAPAAIWDDVRSFDGRPWRGLVDGIIGGIPCQPHSFAGRKQGSLDARDLWSSARRIIVSARPWFVLIENVRGMLSAGADEIAGAERVWRDLRRLGYTVELGLFTASEVGASQLRPRVFILAVANAGRAEWRQGVERGNLTDGHEGRWEQGAGRIGEPSQNVADTKRDGWGEGYAGPDIWRRTSQLDANGDDALAGTASRAQRTGLCKAGHRPSAIKPRDCGSAVARSGEPGLQGREPDGVTGPWPTRRAAKRSGSTLAGADFAQLRQQPPAGQQPQHQRNFALGLFPPGPDDREGWSEVLGHAPELEPAFRRMADGVAPEMGARIDELRLLGNGVVSLAAAYAFRTLVARLAGRREAGAIELLRLMGAEE